MRTAKIRWLCYPFQIFDDFRSQRFCKNPWAGVANRGVSKSGGKDNKHLHCRLTSCCCLFLKFCKSPWLVFRNLPYLKSGGKDKRPGRTGQTFYTLTPLKFCKKHRPSPRVKTNAKTPYGISLSNHSRPSRL